jgi:hypothetical protein
MRPQSRTLASGALFVAFGAAGLWFGRMQSTGTLLRMGPGWLPRALSLVLVALGVVVLLAAWRRSDAAATDDPDGGASVTATGRALLLITIAIGAFAWLLERAGLIAAVLALVLIGCAAEPRRGLVGPALLAVLLALLSWAIFIGGLGMPIPLWPESP